MPHRARKATDNVFHEDPGITGELVCSRFRQVAKLQGIWQLVASPRHQPVTYPVDALVLEELVQSLATNYRDALPQIGCATVPEEGLGCTVISSGVALVARQRERQRAK